MTGSLSSRLKAKTWHAWHSNHQLGRLGAPRNENTASTLTRHDTGIIIVATEPALAPFAKRPRHPSVYLSVEPVPLSIAMGRG
jgi:hypothetical protein